jgi:hypothetical protein
MGPNIWPYLRGTRSYPFKRSFGGKSNYQLGYESTSILLIRLLCCANKQFSYRDNTRWGHMKPCLHSLHRSVAPVLIAAGTQQSSEYQLYILHYA